VPEKNSITQTAATVCQDAQGDNFKKKIVAVCWKGAMASQHDYSRMKNLVRWNKEHSKSWQDIVSNPSYYKLSSTCSKMSVLLRNGNLKTVRRFKMHFSSRKTPYTTHTYFLVLTIKEHKPTTSKCFTQLLSLRL